jgi:vancomycin aglycone glucosyltransferase
MIALALALKQAGHEVHLGATPTFASEAAALGLPFTPVGMDTQQVLKQHRERMNHRNPLEAVRLLNSLMVQELHAQWEGFIPLARGHHLVVGGGAMISARSAAEAARVPYRYVVYTPQSLPSAWHLPFMVPLTRSPRWVNRLCWAAARALYNRLARPAINERRHSVGLEPVSSIIDHIFSPEHALVAADPELSPRPPDVSSPQVGAFHLADMRPLPPEVERFLTEGERPVYIGFGSMPDARPEETSRLLAEAARRAGCRALLSSGWAGLGGEGLGSHVQVVGPLSHWQLFPRVAGTVHHGGAGTTSASTRAGVPQVVVPHAFDQFLFAAQVRRAGIGTSVNRKNLTVERLASALAQIRQDSALRERAARLGEQVRARNSLAATVELLERAAG